MTLQHAILTALHNVDGYALPEDALLVDVNALRPAHKVTLSELRAKLAALERARLVVGITPKDSEAPAKWSLTDNGRAEALATA